MNEELISLFLKTLIANFCIYYSAIRLLGVKNKTSKTICFGGCNCLITIIYTILNSNINTIILIFLMYMLFAVILGKLYDIKNGITILSILISYAISSVALVIGVMLGFAIYKYVFNENMILGTLTGSLIQFSSVWMFFRIKRFRNGFAFLTNKMNNETFETIVVCISIMIVLIAALMSTMYDGMATIVNNLLAVLILLGITMYIMIQRTLTMQYKHSLLLKTLEEYKEEIDSKDKEIEKLSQEKFNTSKIRHEFYNRQKALELMVKQNMNGNIDKDGVSENILNIVNELTNEYSKECEIIKGLNVLPKTNIVEIDNMFKYMQTECAKNNIDFKLNIQDSLEPLINNYISKSRLETLLGDHIRDAINAVNKSEKTNKEIMVVLGLKDGVYEICILDNGVEFTIDTLLKLGKEQVTTGGTGIGFLTTFETLKETKASLVISELQDLEYTKSVAFVFNNRCEYVVNSYRAEAIKEKCDREDIIINKNEG